MALGRAAPVSVKPSPGGLGRRLWWIPAVGAGVALGSAAACLAVSRQDYARLDPAGGTDRIGLSDAQATARRGSALQTASVVLFATAGAAALATVGVLVFGSDVQLGAAVTPSTASFSLTGVLP